MIVLDSRFLLLFLCFLCVYGQRLRKHRTTANSVISTNQQNETHGSNVVFTSNMGSLRENHTNRQQASILAAATPSTTTEVVHINIPNTDTQVNLPPQKTTGIHYIKFNTTHEKLVNVCQDDEELTNLVHTPGTRLHIFMLYHSQRTHQVAKKFAFCRDYVTPVYLRQTKYMESIIYRDIFHDENMTSIIESYDYVIICTYRHGVSLGQLNGAWVHPLTPPAIKNLLHTAKREDFDVIPLEIFPLTEITFSLSLHHKLNAVKAWNALLINMNFTSQEMQQANTLYAFWRSSYMIRPSVLRTLSQLMRAAMDIAEDVRLTSLQRYIRSDAHYATGDPLVAHKIFGTPYYQMHPFLFERLPSFLLHRMHAKVNITRHPRGDGSVALQVREDWRKFLVRDNATY